MLEATTYTRIIGAAAIGEVLVCSREPTDIGKIFTVKLYLLKIFLYIFCVRKQQITVVQSVFYFLSTGWHDPNSHQDTKLEYNSEQLYEICTSKFCPWKINERGEGERGRGGLFLPTETTKYLTVLVLPHLTLGRSGRDT